jgi:hypothetical protein
MMIGAVSMVFWLSKYTLYEYIFQGICLRMIFGLKKNSNRLLVIGIMLLVWFYDTIFVSKSTQDTPAHPTESGIGGVANKKKRHLTAIRFEIERQIFPAGDNRCQ